jgi:hypothetical protein
MSPASRISRWCIHCDGTPPGSWRFALHRTEPVERRAPLLEHGGRIRMASEEVLGPHALTAWHAGA